MADDGGDGDGDLGDMDGGAFTPSPASAADSNSDDTDLNDRSSGIVSQDPFSVSGQGFANSSFGSTLGNSNQSLGEAAAALIDALDQNGINSDISGIGTVAPQPYSLLNDIEKVYSGKDSPSSSGQTVQSFGSDGAFGVAATLFGGVVGVLTAPEIAVPVELIDMGILDFSALYSAAKEFANGAAVAVEVTSAFEWADFFSGLPQNTAVRAAAIQSIYDNSRPSVFASPTPAPGPTPAASRMPDMSLSNFVLLK
jgi:hypothetical protein